jgi:hypothetical protein
MSDTPGTASARIDAVLAGGKVTNTSFDAG